MIDWNRVIELRDELGADEAAPIFDMILQEVEAQLSGLHAQPGPLADDLHMLRGLAVNLGFVDFCALCLHAEQQLARDEGFDLGPAALRASFGHSKQLFLRDLPHILGQDMSGTAARA